ncbi:hypothetical protein KBC59_02420 [Patescibacteria group bacterium]|nr:hypothetical protein [Patescibacteria group bacterium]
MWFEFPAELGTLFAVEVPHLEIEMRIFGRPDNLKGDLYVLDLESAEMDTLLGFVREHELLDHETAPFPKGSGNGGSDPDRSDRGSLTHAIQLLCEKSIVFEDLGKNVRQIVGGPFSKEKESRVIIDAPVGTAQMW